MPNDQITTQGPSSASGRIKVATVDVSEDFKTVTMSFSSGDVLEYNVENFPSNIRARNEVHGSIQKLRDTYAGVKGDAKLAYANAKETFDSMMEGNWSTRGESDGTGGQGALYIEAIARIKGITLEDARGRVAKQSDEWKKAAQKDPQVVTVVAQIKLERAQAAVEAAKGRGAEAGSVSLDDLFEAAA